MAMKHFASQGLQCNSVIASTISIMFLNYQPYTAWEC